MAKPMHDVFRMRMHIPGFMPIAHLWTFRVYPDEELFIDLQRCDDGDDQDDEHEYQFLVGSRTGVSEWRPIRDLPGDYACEFTLVKCGADDGILAGDVRGTLSGEYGFRGTWSEFETEDSDGDVDGDGEGLWSFEDATEIMATVEPVPTFPLSRLTPGRYSFKGLVFDREGRTVRCVQADVQLQSQALLFGRITDLSNGDFNLLEGIWSRSEIIFAEDDGGQGLVCSLHAKRHFLAGHGEVTNRIDITDCFFFTPREHYTISLITPEARRRWSPADYGFYPANFRKAVRLCLLSSTCKTPPIYNLLGELWLHVFGFCDVEWFE